MTEYIQRKSDREEIKNPVRVAFKTDLTDKFHDLATKEMKNIGAHYFAHNLIKNPFLEGHTVSSFHTNLDWQEKFWNEYWDYDSVYFAITPIVKTNGCAVLSWKVVDPDSDYIEDRKTMCKISDGVTFEIEHNNGVLENFSFGWEKYDISRVNRKKLLKLCNMISDFRIQHFRLNRDMFDIFPAVEFH